MGDTTSDKKIFVGGLSWKTQTDGLRSYFEKFGEIDEAAVIIDRHTHRSKGYGFVTFKYAEAAQKACGDPSPIIDGRTANCNLASLGSHNGRTHTSNTPQPRQYQQVSQQPFPHPLRPYAEHPRFYRPPQYSYNYPYYSYSPNSPSYPRNNMPLFMGPPNARLGDMNPGRNCFPTFSTEPPFGLANQYGTSGSTNMPVWLLQMAKELELGAARHKNFVFSPGSIQLALSLAANGSTSATLDEILAFLGAKDLDYLNTVATELIASLTRATEEEGPRLSFVGGTFVDQSLTLKQTFKDNAATIYHANAKDVDFANNIKMAIEEVNKWAEEATNGLIESILPLDLTEDTRVVLTNAIYFKGAWSSKFDEKYTRKSTFCLLDGSPLNGSYIVVPFMHSREDQYINTYPDFKILRLPYKTVTDINTALSMYIILPNQVDGIWGLIENVGSDPSFLQRHLRIGSRVEVGEFRIPKFKMAFDFEASEVLKSIGLERCFSDAAEFDEMVYMDEENPGLKITRVFHKAVIEVNEEGTEAAAATAVVMEPCWSAGPPPRALPVDFIADHPFMFIVKDDKTGLVLFMGHIINPLS